MIKKPVPQMDDPEDLHKNQVLLQILIPVVITIMICLTTFFLLLIGESGDVQTTAQWANISVMFLIVPAAFMGLIVLLILILVSKMTGTWNKKLPSPLKNIRLKAIEINQTIQSAAQKPATPVIVIKSVFAGIKSIFIKYSDWR